MDSVRSSLFVSYAVWRALFLREALTRVAGGRGAWLWILLEPIAQVVLLMFMFGYIYHRIISGVDGAMFIMTGLLSYQMARNTATRSTEAVRANEALFSYRQVKPVDTVLVRAFLEASLMFTNGLLILAGAGFLGYAIAPANIFTVVGAFLLMGLCGLGLGLIFSVATEFVPELRKALDLLWMPVYFLSAVMYPVTAIPHPYRELLLWNPFVHGVEMVRFGFYAQYTLATGTSLSYLAMWALSTVALGLALHVRHANRLAAQ
jgi:capsular polysaccharide transport system permease protein